MAVLFLVFNYFKEASQKNLLHAIVKLFKLVVLYHLMTTEVPRLTPKPPLFGLPDLFFRAPNLRVMISKLEDKRISPGFSRLP
jgi:hypothetical protein